MKVFVHINNSLQFRTAEVNADHKIGHLVKEFVPEMSHNQDFLEDVEVYLENQDDDFDKGISVQEAGIKHGDHIFVGRCKKISVTIIYAGKTFATSVGPATTTKKLKKLAIEFFEIDEVGGAELMLWFKKEVLDLRQLVGSLTDYPSCGVSLVLASKNDVNGDLSHDLFQNHLNFPEYQSGEIEGRWGTINNENGPSWPVFFFWVNSSTDEKFNFKFDFTGYPNEAPTGVLWDIENNRVLEQSKRPLKTKRASQVFKVWGIECNYLPCDRLAFDPGHEAAWTVQHPDLIWNSQTDTFFKYLNEVHQILNL